MKSLKSFLSKPLFIVGIIIVVAAAIAIPIAVLSSDSPSASWCCETGEVYHAERAVEH